MKKLFVSVTLLLSAAAAVCAQDYKSGFFLDNYVYGYRTNPAAPIAEDDSYTFIGLGIGNVTAEANLNFPFSSIINKTGTGDLVFPLISPQFTEAQVLENLLPDNGLMLDANVNILSFGRQDRDSRWNVELNLRTNNYVNAPKDFFKLVKRGLASLETGEYDPDYSFNGMALDSKVFTELAFGYSRKIGDFVTVGARLKALAGIADASLGWNLSIGPALDENLDIRVRTDASIRASAPVSFPLVQKDGRYMLDLGAFDFKPENVLKNIVSGWGAAADLGVTVEPLEGLQISASVNDLGFISWKPVVNGNLLFEKEILGKDYEDIFGLESNSDSRYSTMLNYTVHAGVRYHMPFYDRLSVGLLGTFQQHNKEGRFGITVTPLDFISIAGSAAYGTFGPSFGAALNFHLPVVNFFVGMDSLVLNYLPGTFVPSGKVNTTVNAGLLLVI